MIKLFTQNYHNHLLLGVLIGFGLLGTYAGVPFVMQLFFTSLFSFIVGYGWEGLSIKIGISDKFDKIDCGLVVAGGLLSFVLPESVSAWCVYAFLISGFIYFIQLITRKKWNKK